MTSTSRSSVGESAKERWMRSKVQFEELAKCIQAYRLWLEKTLNDSSPGSQGIPDYLSSPLDSQST